MSRGQESQGDQAEWVAIATFATGFEADMARQTLEAEGIPVLVQSNAPGIFGAGYQGGVSGGVTLHVPSPIVQSARDLLGGGDFDVDDFEISP